MLLLYLLDSALSRFSSTVDNDYDGLIDEENCIGQDLSFLYGISSY